MYHGTAVYSQQFRSPRFQDWKINFQKLSEQRSPKRRLEIFGPENMDLVRARYKKLVSIFFIGQLS